MSNEAVSELTLIHGWPCCPVGAATCGTVPGLWWLFPFAAHSAVPCSLALTRFSGVEQGLGSVTASLGCVHTIARLAGGVKCLVQLRCSRFTRGDSVVVYPAARWSFTDVHTIAPLGSGVKPCYSPSHLGLVSGSGGRSLSLSWWSFETLLTLSGRVEKHLPESGGIARATDRT